MVRTTREESISQHAHRVWFSQWRKNPIDVGIPGLWPLPCSVPCLSSGKTSDMNVAAPTYDELLDQNRRQARLIEELRAEVERLKAELEQSRRAGKRQAAPFPKGAPKADPERPGREPGHPPSHRPAPAPGQVDRTIEVPLPGTCPECHAPLDGVP